MALGSYDANGIWHYGESDNIALFSDTLNKLADSASSAITADRSRIATLEAGSLSGLIPIVPQTVQYTGGTVSTNTLGVVTFAGSTAVSLNGVFTASFKNYKIIWNLYASSPSGGAAWYMRLRNGGSDASTADYYSGGIDLAASTVTGINTSGNQLLVGSLGSTYTSEFAHGSMELYRPKETKATGYNYQSACVYSGNNYSSIRQGEFTQTNSFDGFSFYPGGAGNMSGTVQVFGFND